MSPFPLLILLLLILLLMWLLSAVVGVVMVVVLAVAAVVWWWWQWQHNDNGAIGCNIGGEDFCFESPDLVDKQTLIRKIVIIVN